MSIAVIETFGRFLAKEIGMHPVPVPMSKIENFSTLEFCTFAPLCLCTFVTSLTIHSTNSSVSDLGINVFFVTLKGKP